MQINVYKYEHQKLYNSIATVTILLIYQIGHAIAVCWKMIFFGINLSGINFSALKD